MHTRSAICNWLQILRSTNYTWPESILRGSDVRTTVISCTLAVHFQQVSMYIQYSITCDDGVSFIVEGTTEYLIAMTFQNLQTLASSCTPQTCTLVRTSCQQTSALRIEANLLQWSKHRHWPCRLVYGKYVRICLHWPYWYTSARYKYYTHTYIHTPTLDTSPLCPSSFTLHLCVTVLNNLAVPSAEAVATFWPV